MMRLYSHSLHRLALGTWLAVGLTFACATSERTFNDKQANEVGGSSAGTSSFTAGTNATAGKNNSGGSANGSAQTTTGGTGNGGVPNGGTATSAGGVTSTAGTSAVGGTKAVGGSTSNGGGSATTGGFATTGGSAVAGGPAGTGGVKLTGGASNGGTATGTGGTPVSTGGAPASTGGAPVTTGGRSNATGGSKATGGAVPTGGTKATGGAPTGGSPGAGGTCAATENPEVSCADGIDNDCNGTVDCPVIKARYPEPGGASAGDDASVTLAQPVQAIARVECRSGKPSVVGAKAWIPCDPANPTALTVYSMSSAEAQTVANNGVAEFQFRFAYATGAVSDPRSVAYYAHNSLWENVPRTPRDACTPIQPDDAYFAAAKPYIAPDTTTPTFAAADAQLKRPFVFFRFAPKYINDFVLATAPREIKILSLRHRFVIDPSRQMLLVTRAYKSSRAGTCGPAMILDHETHLLGAVRPTPWFVKGRHYKVPCDVIVMNKAGTGVCLGASSTSIRLLDANSSLILPFLQSLGIPWPQADPMMWQKLFRFIPSRNSLQFFSDKCATEDALCQSTHPGMPVLPDSSDSYFTSP